VTKNAPLEIAIRNFIGHCQAIPTALGFPGTQTPHFSSNPHTLDIPYPQGITTGGAENSQSQIVQIQLLLASRPAATLTGVVDSYSTLDLKLQGFEILFSTGWDYREPAPISPQPVIDRPVETVHSPDQLRQFDRAAAIGFGQPDADVVYSTPLLSDSRYSFYFIRQSNEVVAGVQSFTNDESIGIYTLFTHPDYRRRGYARALTTEALSHAPGLPATTNPSNDSAHLFGTLSFAKIGERTIWDHRG
jgi:ribosomal protein S18 acetylase RimI-like enzyme